MTLLFYILFASFPVSSSSFPLESRSNTTNDTNAASPKLVGWVEAPNVRGTSDLLLSCLTTLSLCAWTAYHPNVFTAKNEWRRVGKRALWMAIAVLVPEVVLWCAREQWWASRKLKDAVDTLGDKSFDGIGGEVDDLGKDDEDDDEEDDCEGCRIGEHHGRYSRDYGLERLFTEEDIISDQTLHDEPAQANEGSPPDPEAFHLFKPSTWKRTPSNDPEKGKILEPPTWTHEIAFFATSGGFAVDCSAFYPLPTLTLTPTALHFLARHGLLPKTTPNVVTDKSKADYVAKILVCIQAGWFLVQSIARRAQNLPLTLLEIHVLAHVGCAFAMYWLWIDKPYDVGSPIMVEDERVRNLVAFWALDDGSPSYNSSRDDGDETHCAMYGKVSMMQIQGAHQRARSPSTRHRYYTLLAHYLMLDRKNSFPIQFGDNKVESTKPDPPTETQQLHHQYASAGLDYLSTRSIHFPYLSKNPRTDPSSSKNQISHSIRFPIRHVTPTRSNLIVDGLPTYELSEARSKQTFSALRMFAIISILYGGLHLSAWNYIFASAAEMWCWRVSGIVISALPISTVVVWYILLLERHILAVSEKKKREHQNPQTHSDEDDNDNEDYNPSNPSSPTSNSSPQPSTPSPFRTSSLHTLKSALTIPSPKPKSSHAITSTTNSTTANTLPSPYPSPIRKPLTLLLLRLTFRLTRFLLLTLLIPLFFGVLACLALYPLARVFVFVESFAGLRESREGVYQMVEWTGFVPHVG